jgi:hypothetical protein
MLLLLSAITLVGPSNFTFWNNEIFTTKGNPILSIVVAARSGRFLAGRAFVKVCEGSICACEAAVQVPVFVKRAREQWNALL